MPRCKDVPKMSVSKQGGTAAGMDGAPMGMDITQEEFSAADYSRFRERLDAHLGVLSELIKKPGFGTGPTTIGAELELVLVDDACSPLPINQVVRDAVADPRVTLELTRFNLELNASPLP